MFVLKEILFRDLIVPLFRLNQPFDLQSDVLESYRRGDFSLLRVESSELAQIHHLIPYIVENQFLLSFGGFQLFIKKGFP